MGWIDCEVDVWTFFSQAGLILSLMLVFFFEADEAVMVGPIQFNELEWWVVISLSRDVSTIVCVPWLSDIRKTGLSDNLKPMEALELNPTEASDCTRRR